MQMESISEIISNIRQDVIKDVLDRFIPPHSVEEQWDIPGLEEQIFEEFDLQLPIGQWLAGKGTEKVFEEDLHAKITAAVQEIYDNKAEQAGVSVINQFEKQIMLQVLDNLWKDHLATMDHLRQGIHLRGYGQKNPKQEYKRESFILFEQLLHNIKHDTIRILSHVKVRGEEEIQQLEAERRAAAEALAQQAKYQHGDSEENETDDNSNPFVREEKKVGQIGRAHV